MLGCKQKTGSKAFALLATKINLHRNCVMVVQPLSTMSACNTVYITSYVCQFLQGVPDLNDVFSLTTFFSDSF